MLRAEGIAAEVPALSTFDAFAFVVAEEREGSILLTGDRRLRNLGEKHQIEVHGVLWVVEEISRHEKATEKRLHEALCTWRDDPTVRLPAAELARVLARFERR